MNETRDTVTTDSDSPAGDGLPCATEPREMLMARLASVYEPRVVDWLQRIERATRDGG